MNLTRINRRELIALISAAAWPMVARAQQSMPVIGLLGVTSPDTNVDRLRAFHRGLKDSGYVEGESVTIIYRWAENQIDRLPALAADLVRRRVSVIVAHNSSSVPVAKAATTTIPIVFAVSEDPVRLGLVASLAQPGGNLTGINFFSGELGGKRLELLRELVPTATRVAVLVNPTNAASSTASLKEVEAAARHLGMQIQIVRASTDREIDAAFATFVRESPDGVYVAGDAFFTSRRVQLTHLAARHAIPATYGNREITEGGGLMSYGTNRADAFRQMGIYTGRILKGEKPADLPVVQSTKFELVINAQIARMLGLTVPPSLLAIAEEVIE
jgi:putative ABC transport system substrate-binding protein